MLHTNQFSNISKHEEISIEEVDDGNDGKRRYSHIAENLISYKLSTNHYQNDQEETTYTELNLMIMGPKKYESIIRNRKLFQLFQLRFIDNIKEIIQQIFDPNKCKDDKYAWPNLCLIHKNRIFKNIEDPLLEREFHDKSVLYILLIPPSTESIQSVEDFPFPLYNPPKLSECSTVLLRIYEQDQHSNTNKYRFIRIENTEEEENQTLGQFIKQSFKEFDEEIHNISYYTNKLSPNTCPWNDKCINSNDDNKMIIIFDITTNHQEQTIKTTQQLFVTLNPLIVNRKYDKQINKRSLYETYAYVFYIRLRLSEVIYYQQNENIDTEENISDMIYNFYLFCDKDKSLQLDPRERTIGLLTLFKYIDDEQNQLNGNIIIPIDYKTSQNRDQSDSSKENDFRSLIIDTLTEYLRIQTFGHPNNPINVSFYEMNKKLDKIILNFEETLRKHLQRKTNQYETLFSFKNIMLHIGLFLLCFIFLPIVCFYTIIQNYSQNKISFIKSKLILIIILILVTLLSAIVYLIIIQIILYYINYDQNKIWHVSALEVYWPFTLIVCIIFIACLYGSPFLVHSDYRKNKQLEDYYNQAEMDMLKHQAKVVVFEHRKRQQKTMAQWESQSIYLPKEKNKLTTILWKIGLITLISIIAILHGCFPTIYREYYRNYTYPINETKSSEVDNIEISFIITSIIVYFLFLLMIIYSYYIYRLIGIELDKIMTKTANNNNYNVANKIDCYLDLKDHINLDLFLSQLRNIINTKEKIEYQLAIAFIGSALLIDLILGIVAISRLISYGVGGLITLTGTFILIDMIILSIVIIIFLINISLINTRATTDVQDLLLRTKKEILNGTASSDVIDKNNNVTYLTAMTEQLSNNKQSYSISFFGFIIDNAFIFRIGLTLLIQISAAIASVVNNKLHSD